MLKLYSVLYSDICCGYTTFDMIYVDRPVKILKTELDLTSHVFPVSVQNKDNSVHRHRYHRPTAQREWPTVLNNIKVCRIQGEQRINKPDSGQSCFLCFLCDPGRHNRKQKNLRMHIQHKITLTRLVCFKQPQGHSIQFCCNDTQGYVKKAYLPRKCYLFSGWAILCLVMSFASQCPFHTITVLSQRQYQFLCPQMQYFRHSANGTALLLCVPTHMVWRKGNTRRSLLAFHLWFSRRDGH